MNLDIYLLKNIIYYYDYINYKINLNCVEEENIYLGFVVC